MVTRARCGCTLAVFIWVWPASQAVFAAGEVVSVWLTNSSQSKKLEPQATVSFSASSTGGGDPIHVDETQVYQQIEGFGAAFTDSAAYLLNQVAKPGPRQEALERLFLRKGEGIGVSFVRCPMGSSDLARSHYSYDDLPPGQTDVSLTMFSIAHDEADIIPLLLEALALNPQLKIMASPWSPPGWMKDSGTLIGGSLLASMYGPFAGYFVKYVQAYAAKGIAIDYVSLQNEPLYVPADYPGMMMDAAAQTTVLKSHLLPAFSSAGLGTRVLVYDHNWDRPDYPDDVLGDASILASSQVAGIAWHGYGGTPGVMTSLRNKYPAKGNYETELSGGTWVGDPVKSDFETITHSMRSWSKAFVKWSLALDQNHGPHSGGCGTCSPLVTVNRPAGTVAYTIELYTLGHFSKFVLPGASRIFSSNGPGIVTAAFKNPDGSKALVAFNEASSARTIEIEWGTQSFSFSLPGLTGATFTWAGTQSGSSSIDPTLEIEASSFHGVSGLQTEPCSDTLGGYNVGYAEGGDYAVYKAVDFGGGDLSGVDVRVASDGSGGTLELRLDRASGHLIASVTIPVTGGWQTWRTVTAAVSGASGVRDLFAVFKGTTGIGNVSWLRFDSRFLRGDVNLDGVVDIADAVRALLALFAGKATECPDSIDSNDDGALNVTDVTHLLRYLFLQGPAPPAPGTATCGRDPTPDVRGCAEPSKCP